MPAPGFGAAARCSRNPKASGTITIDITPRMNMVVCQLSSRYCSSDTNGTMANWPNDPPAVVADKRRERAHQQHRQCIGERPQLAADMEVGCDRLLKNAEALARAHPDGEDHGPADHGDPEAALSRLGGGFGWGHKSKLLRFL
jgi:hypothetical protein